jgi:hypothetical protein
MTITSPRSPLGRIRFQWGLVGDDTDEDGRVNGEVLAMLGCLSCESIAHGPAAG